MRDDLTVFSPEVAKDVFKPGTDFDVESSVMIEMKENLEKNLKPLEMRVSKSKEKGKGYWKYMLFCSQNLRLYNNVEEYLKDMKEFRDNSRIIDRKIEKIRQLAKINSSVIREEFMSVDNTELTDEQKEVDSSWQANEPFESFF